MPSNRVTEIKAHPLDTRSYALEFVRENEPSNPNSQVVCGALAAQMLANGFGVPITFLDEHLAIGVGV